MNPQGEPFSKSSQEGGDGAWGAPKHPLFLTADLTEGTLRGVLSVGVWLGFTLQKCSSDTDSKVTCLFVVTSKYRGPFCFILSLSARVWSVSLVHMCGFANLYLPPFCPLFFVDDYSVF